MFGKEILDRLPEDIHERIATFVRSSSYYDALTFAQQSEKQRLAMVEALGSKLVVSDVFKHDVEDWIAVFGDSVRTLDSSRLTSRDLPESFVDLPNLSHAEIYGKGSHFRAVRRNPRLKSLKVVLHCQADWGELVDTCASLPLTELSLQCEWTGCCIRSRLDCEELYRLSKACPYVTKLTMKCTCEYTRSFWPLVSSFKGLKHLSLHANVDEEGTEFLDTLKEVELHENMPIRKVIPIGRRVTAVTQLRRAKKETVELLASFPKLKVLRLAMLNGAEKALPGVIEKVQELDVSWGYDDFYDEIDDTGYGDGIIDVDQEVTSYYPVDEGFVKEILHSARYLRELYLRRAVVKVGVVEHIIEKLGKRLEILSLHMDQQGEPPAMRLLRILHAASMFCPNLKKIELLGPLVEKEATWKQKQSCYTALNLLKRTSPLVATTKLRQYIDGIEEVPDT